LTVQWIASEKKSGLSFNENGCFALVGHEGTLGLTEVGIQERKSR